jgi:DNA invertase Pin-like site-specific DNA recombinase
MGTTAPHPATAAVTVPVAFIGRTSTTTMQDPVESLSKQLRISRDRLPEGFVITRYYWDVESGGTDLDRRSRSDVWQQFTAAGIPRDGGMADLRAAVKSGNAPFATVICENIERSGRDTYDALRLEKELHAAGIFIIATDEPIDAHAPEAAVILVRRVKQGMAEYFRLNIKTQLWEGLRQYAISGHNTGPCPYGYAEDRTVHPNPMKASMGATRARLVPDPERGPWVTRMYQWRVGEKLSVPGIARRLTELGVPAPDPSKPWSPGTIAHILANPKYTGRVVIGRTRNTATEPGKEKFRPVPREHWTWAGDGNEHPALVSMDLWEAAQAIGRERGNVADRKDRPAGQRADYPLRARMRCAQCKRRMVARANPGRKPGISKVNTWYVCPHHPGNPRHAAAAPNHVRASVKDRVIYAAVDGLLSDYLLGYDRAAMLAAVLPATQAEAGQQTQARAEQLRQQITRSETAQAGLITQLEQLGSDTSPAAKAMRERITAAFSDRYHQAAALQSELDNLNAAQAPAQDPALIDELPYAAAHLADLPDDLRGKLYAAFDIQVLYREHKNQATVWATVTDTTPGIVAALLDNPEADDDPGEQMCGHSAPAPIGRLAIHYVSDLDPPWLSGR